MAASPRSRSPRAASRNGRKHNLHDPVELDSDVFWKYADLGQSLAQITVKSTLLRWGRIVGNVIQVSETLEQTKEHGISFKPPKTKAGRRDVTMPNEVIAALRAYRGEQLELRLHLGLGKLADDVLFTDVDGKPRSLAAASKAWSDFAAHAEMPDVTYHGLRHSHASMLIDAGVDIVTISKRLGHAKPDITLRVYAPPFQKGRHQGFHRH